MENHIALISPQEIYDDLRIKIDKIIIEIIRNDGNIESQLASESINKSREILSAQHDLIIKQIKELEDNSEWEYFTVAFFGETNAGKSTIIETLRILFEEPTKLDIQNKFDQYKAKYNLDEFKYEQLRNKLVNITNNILESKNILCNIDKECDEVLGSYQIELDNLLEENEKKVIEFDLENTQKLEAYNIQIATLLETIKYKKQIMSWLVKILYCFKKIEEEKQLELLNLELLQLKTKLDYQRKSTITQLKQKYLSKETERIAIQAKYMESKKQQSLIVLNLEEQQKKIEIQIQDFIKNLEVLYKYEDGQIIGDGRSDYTRRSHEFIFNIAGIKVKLIDVPGIEGNESLVEKEISNAVKKAHAVFFVTSKDAAPNEGTLEKVKKHLAAQTEVWTIYNKPVTSARVLKGELIKNADERLSLDELDHLMNKILGQNYKNSVVIAGLAAFYTIATHLVFGGEKYRGQAKFLDIFNRDELKKRSGLEAFHTHIIDKIIGDVSYKIQSSNFNKVNHILLQTIDTLNIVDREFTQLREDFNKQIVVTKQEIESDQLDLIQQLKNMIENSIRAFKQSTRDKVYQAVDEDISNDDFKKILKTEIEKNLKVTSDHLTAGFQDQISEFDGNLKKRLEKLSSRLSSIQRNFTSDFKDFNQKIDLDFDINSGINKLGLLGVGLGIAATMWWNPAGWVAISLTAVGLIFSFAKAIWSFFDSDFKKSEQRKSTDKNLSNIAKELKKVAVENLNEIEVKIGSSVFVLKNELNNPSEQITQIILDISQSSDSFKELSENITMTYGVK